MTSTKSLSVLNRAKDDLAQIRLEINRLNHLLALAYDTERKSRLEITSIYYSLEKLTDDFLNTADLVTKLEHLYEISVKDKYAKENI